MKKIIDLSNADRVTKTYLIDYLMVEKGFSREDATEAVNGTIDGIVTALRAGVDVSISNVGTFRYVPLEARMVRNPRTGGFVEKGPGATVRWTISPTLRGVLHGETDREFLSVKAPKSR